MRALNCHETYLKAVLGFIGITDVEVIAMEGIAFGGGKWQRQPFTALARVDAIAP
jgi:FMN-dependent NADH-azoreductase